VSKTIAIYCASQLEATGPTQPGARPATLGHGLAACRQIPAKNRAASPVVPALAGAGCRSWHWCQVQNLGPRPGLGDGPFRRPSMVALSSDLQTRFLAILPRIRTHALVYFRHVKCQVKKEEAVAEVIALAWKWFVRLVQRGKDATEFVSTLATYAARAVQNGRRLCGQLKAKDVMNEHAQQRHGFRVEQLPLSTRTCHEELNGITGQRVLDAYEERLHDNTRTPPDEQAAFRIDFPAWLTTRTERDRRIINDMAVGEAPVTWLDALACRRLASAASTTKTGGCSQARSN
jgi:hypothetical protein